MNTFFDKIYCINLDRRTDRWDESKLEFEKLNLIVERISAIDGNNLVNNTGLKSGALALTLTVSKIIKHAIKKKYKRILILEDDVEFTDKISLFNEKIKSLPSNWDLLYLGGNHNGHAGFPPPIYENEHFVKIHSTYSSHAIGFSRNGLKLIKNKLNLPLKEIDLIYADIQKSGNAYCFSELMATQRTGYSDIENQIVNYKDIIT